MFSGEEHKKADVSIATVALSYRDRGVKNKIKKYINFIFVPSAVVRVGLEPETTR